MSYFSWRWLVSLRWPLDPGPSALLRVHSQLLLLLYLLLRRLLPLQRLLLRLLPLLLPLLVQHHPVKVPLLHSLLRLLLRGPAAAIEGRHSARSECDGDHVMLSTNACEWSRSAVQSVVAACRNGGGGIPADDRGDL